ncbi:single-stranded DNA-binding protein [Methylobacterium sp. 1030]|uniref:single-stranded DNA-binding protein n=1 Tax=Methylobacterium sp. 1030 TaxID=3156404 RepID=UPI003390C4F9
MAGKFKFIGVGRVGNDPEIRTFPDGGLVANFSIAASESWKDGDGQKQTRTEWARIVVRDKGLIENVIEPYVKQGSQVFVNATPETRTYEKDGAKHSITEMVLRAFRDDSLTLADTMPKQDRDARVPANQSNPPERSANNYRQQSRGPSGPR